MISDVHTHSNFCDGKVSLAEMAKGAFFRGINTLGFSAHGHTDFDESYCIKDSKGYMAEIARLKKEYKGKMTILCGVERDIFGEEMAGVEYEIISSHYIKNGKKYYPIDCSQEGFDALFDALGAEQVIAKYFAEFAQGINANSQAIIGHFDLLRKYNKGHFLEDSAFYKKAWRSALDQIDVKNRIFEVNTGAMFRMGLQVPYPSIEVLAEINKRGGQVMLNSDAHSVEGIGYKFDEVCELLRAVGFKSRTCFIDGKICKVAL